MQWTQLSIMLQSSPTGKCRVTGVLAVQEHDPGGVQIHLLDGVRTPHVGTGLGLCVCCASCVLWHSGLYQLGAGQEPGALLPHGGHSGAGGLVDGQEWLAGHFLVPIDTHTPAKSIWCVHGILHIDSKLLVPTSCLPFYPPPPPASLIIPYLRFVFSGKSKTRPRHGSALAVCCSACMM